MTKILKDTSPSVDIPQTRCGIVALIGAPNAGKSTLTNAIVGEKVSIVTHKVQTTRQRVTGIAIQGDTQIVLFDTPGVFTPNKRMEKAMVEAAFDAAKDADLRLYILDLSQRWDEEEIEKILNVLKAPFIVVLNKIDLIDHEELLKKASVFNRPGIEKLFMISALKQDGLNDLIAYLKESLPLSPWLYPEEYISDMPERMLAAEVTREQVILQLHQELPYATFVETEAFEEFRNGDVKISQVIAVERSGQKAIVLGNKGERIRMIREASQKQLSEMMGRKVHLFLHVKVMENWQDKQDFYRLTGLNFKA